MAKTVQKLHIEFNMADFLLGVGYDSERLFVSQNVIHVPTEFYTYG